MTSKDTLEKSQALEDKIRALGGQITPEREKQLLKEMLEIRISELISEGLSRTTAIEQTCKEFEKDFEAEKTEEEEKQFELLEETRTELLKSVSDEQAESPEGDSKKKLAEEEEKKEAEKETTNKVSWIANALDFTPVADSTSQPSLKEALNNALPGTTIFMHVNTHQVTFGSHPGSPAAFGKNGNATTLDYDGLKLTGYDMGMHGESRLAISSDATAEQKSRFLDAANKAIAEIGKQRESGYSLLNNNCQKARTTLANAVDPSIQQSSMPWNANAEFEKKYEQQKENRPAPADGSRTNADGKTPEPERRPELDMGPKPPKPESL